MGNGLGIIELDNLDKLDQQYNSKKSRTSDQ